MFGECIHQFVTGYGLPLSLFLAGLAGGFTHCALMCSPFVLAQSGSIERRAGALSRVRNSLLLPYHFGRLTTYVFLAVLFSSVLNLAFLFQPLRTVLVAPMLLLAALMFLVSAFPTIAKAFPWVARVRLSVPFRWISRFYQPLVRERDAASRYALGVLLGFMPCGLVVSALMASSTAPSALQAGVAMAAFGLGTVPALVAVALGGSFLESFRFLGTVKVKQGFMVFSALWLVLLAGAFVF
jgi:sulfite exporter TauE/SafE